MAQTCLLQYISIIMAYHYHLDFLKMARFFLKGLRVGDEVIEFGSVNTGNFQNLQNIASVVQHSEGVIHLMCDVIMSSGLGLCCNFVTIFFARTS